MKYLERGSGTTGTPQHGWGVVGELMNVNVNVQLRHWVEIASTQNRILQGPPHTEREWEATNAKPRESRLFPKVFMSTVERLDA